MLRRDRRMARTGAALSLLVPFAVATLHAPGLSAHGSRPESPVAQRLGGDGSSVTDAGALASTGDDPRAPAIAVHGETAYVVNGGLNEFRLPAGGAVWTRTIPTNGPARSVVLVGDEGDVGGPSDPGQPSPARLGVTGDYTLTVFDVSTGEPVTSTVETWPVPPLEERMLRPFALAGEAVLGIRRYDGFYRWESTDLASPLKY